MCRQPRENRTSVFVLLSPMFAYLGVGVGEAITFYSLASSSNISCLHISGGGGGTITF